MRSLRTILVVASLGCRSSRGIGIAALRTSSTLSKALPAGFMSFAVANRHQSLMTSYGSADLQELLGSYQSNINKFSIKDVSFINSSVAKSIDDDLMFNDGSKNNASSNSTGFTCISVILKVMNASIVNGLY